MPDVRLINTDPEPYVAKEPTPVVQAAEDQLAKKVRQAAHRIRRRNTGKDYPLDRRTMHQTYGHAMAMLDRLWSFRDVAKEARHLDDVQFATEAIYHLKQSLAYMNILSRHKFGCDAEDLATYK